ncbi:TolB family protein [Rubripirellula tenax]|nr:PD40 domain-containing protein [Rubripirellula tenax]
MPKKLVYIMDTGASKADVLMQADSEYDRQGSAVWSPDGTRIGFDSFRSLTGETFRECHVFLTDIDGKEWADLGDGAMPSFSHDASRICFSRYSPNHGVWLMNADGSGKECIDPRGWSPRWSPNGKWIAYTRGANFVLYDPAERKEVRLLLHGDRANRYSTIFWSFDWSRDSKSLAFKGSLREPKANATDDDAQYEVATVNVNGSDHGFEVCYSGKTSDQITWHPDGSLIFSMANKSAGKPQFYTLASNGKAEPELLAKQPDFRWIEGAAWSPDGKRLLMIGTPK